MMDASRGGIPPALLTNQPAKDRKTIDEKNTLFNLVAGGFETLPYRNPTEILLQDKRVLKIGHSSF
jgi:hypothetical protein